MGPGQRAGWVVIGAGGHARSVVDVHERAGERVVAVTGAPPDAQPWHVDLLADDREAVARIEAEHLSAVVAIGANPARASRRGAGCSTACRHR